MTEYERYRIEEHDKAMSEPFCFRCGAFLANTHAGAAHVIARTDPHVRRYTRWIIDSAENLRAACSSCNDYAMGQARGEAEKQTLARQIAAALLSRPVAAKIPDAEKEQIKRIAAGL